MTNAVTEIRPKSVLLDMANRYGMEPAAFEATVRASYGKAASVSMKTVVKDVTDWPALAVYMSNHAECQDLLRKLAQRAVDAGRTGIPGITTREEAKVR